MKSIISRMAWAAIRVRASTLVRLGLTPMEVARVLDWVALVVREKRSK